MFGVTCSPNSVRLGIAVAARIVAEHLVVGAVLPTM